MSTNTMRGRKGFVRTPARERFWSKVNKQEGDGCWLWTGSVSSRYGVFWWEGRRHRAHRVAWEMTHGRRFPAGMDACHTCDNPLCVRPDHIFPGTKSDNARDAYMKGRLYNPQSVKTHCPKGHPLFGQNLYLGRDGKRYCKACRLETNQRWRERRRALAAPHAGGGDNG
jgi:hypothetical protein